jgi:hypothetical protein
MRPLGGRSYTADRKSNPVLALRIDHKYLAVKIDQHVGARIPISILPFHRYKVIIY